MQIHTKISHYQYFCNWNCNSKSDMQIFNMLMSLYISAYLQCSSPHHQLGTPVRTNQPIFIRTASGIEIICPELQSSRWRLDLSQWHNSCKTSLARIASTRGAIAPYKRKPNTWISVWNYAEKNMQNLANLHIFFLSSRPWSGEIEAYGSLFETVCSIE